MLKATARTALEMEEKQAKEIRTAFLSALENASENYKSGQKNNTVNNGDVTYIAFSKNIENKSANELLDVISNNYELIKNSNQIYNIEKEVVGDNHSKVSDNILEYFNSIGNIVYNSEIGAVELVKSGAKTTVTKGYSDKKASAVGAIKDVIERGIIIDRQRKWKGRGYDTVVLAGRGMLYGEDSITGVVVKTYPNNQRQNAKFYLHEIIEIKEADLYKQTAPQLSVDAEHKSTSISSISNSNENVKNSFTVDESVEQVRDLVAVHNLNEEKLMKSLRLGGLPMPSIAVMKAKEAKEIRTAFLSVLENASENYKSGQKNTTDKGDVETKKYALSINAEADIERALNDKNYTEDIKLTDSSPSIIASQKGVNDYPMLMKASHIRENILTSEEAKLKELKVNTHTHYHGLGKGLFLKIIDGLDSVERAYRGTKNAENPIRRENYFLLISQYKDNNGEIVNIPVYINEVGQYNRVFISTNKIATVFGRNNFEDYIRKELENGNLVKIKNRSNQVGELAAPIADSYDKNTPNDSISNSIENVKKSLEVDSDGDTLSKQQQEYFKDSKVRDENGNNDNLREKNPLDVIQRFFMYIY